MAILILTYWMSALSTSRTHLSHPVGPAAEMTLNLVKFYFINCNQRRPLFWLCCTQETLTTSIRQIKRGCPSCQAKHSGTLINLYDNSIISLDAKLDHLLSGLGEKTLNKTVLVFASDHGEAFYEHQSLFHTNIFWQEVIKVPLLIHIPDALKDTPG